MTPIPPPSLYVPAPEEWLVDHVVPIRWRAVGDGPWRFGVWGPVGASSETPAWGIVTSIDGHDRSYEKALDPTRPEVRHLIADRLGLGPEYRSGPYAVPLAWWAGTTGRRLVDVLGVYVPSDMLVGGRPQLYTRRSASTLLSVLVAADGWSISRNGVHVWDRADCVARGPETGDAGKLAADAAALAHDFALVIDGGLLLPPLAPGGAPILWSTTT